ncbi:MAG TPA: DMT family transporter [Caldimonas sp.]|nr:DMT family transporter [Caldimonas sp.]
MTRSYWFLLSLLAAIWGASYLFIKVAVRDFSPPAMMEFRLAIAGLLLGGFLVATRGFRQAIADVRATGWHGLALGVVNGAIPFTLIALGEKYIDSGVAAIANSTVPIFNVMLAPVMLPSERTTGVRLVGFVLGLVGVGVLSGAQPTVTTLFVLGTLAVVLASVSYAFAGLYAQKRLRSASGPALATASMFGGAIALLPLAVIFAPTQAPHWKSIASLAALTIFGTALAQLILYLLIRSDGAAKTSLVTYLMPPIALVYGAILLDETITAATLAGLGLILGGVALGSGALRLARRAPAVQEP